MTVVQRAFVRCGALFSARGAVNASVAAKIATDVSTRSIVVSSAIFCSWAIEHVKTEVLASFCNRWAGLSLALTAIRRRVENPARHVLDAYQRNGWDEHRQAPADACCRKEPNSCLIATFTRYRRGDADLRYPQEVHPLPRRRAKVRPARRTSQRTPRFFESLGTRQGRRSSAPRKHRRCNLQPATETGPRRA